MGGEVVVVVLARGRGRRMREAPRGSPSLTPGQRAAADAGQKAMMPIAGADGVEHPFLDYVLSTLADAGFRQVCLVVGPEQDELRRRYSQAPGLTRIRLKWAVQPEPRGTADAVAAAEAFVAARPFVVVNADNLYPVEGLRTLLSFEGPGLLVFERDELAASSRIGVERLAGFAMPMLSPDGSLADIVEKPDVSRLQAAGAHALISMNAWRFDGRIFQACRDVPVSARGEFELPDAVRLAITRGVRFRAIAAHGPVLDLTSRDDIQHVASRLAGYRARL
jgi:glucose-1-phosphate thymidylyltransferase